MTEGTLRRLTTIVAADIAGFSRLVGNDEEGTLAAQRKHRTELIEPLLAKHHGRIANTAGDSFLFEFSSAVEAVRCSMAVQGGMAERNREIPTDRRIEYRIGINVGDVVADGNDLLGDGVNIAARLEGICEPGGIILSDDAYRQVRDRIDLAWENGGEHEVKNIARPVQVWRWGIASEVISTPSKEAPLVLPDKPSVAILPFDNLSSDPENAFFADGIVEDLTTSLSRFSWLFVIARNSSFSYKGKNVPIKQVSDEFGVRYVVEGSVRSSPTRLRVTVQLVDAVNDRHVWADSYDRPSGDLFDLQDEITQAITGVLIPALSSAERNRSVRDNRPSLDAWRSFQRGLVHFYRPYNDVDHAEARRLFDLSIELDGGFADAHAMVALMGVYAVDSGQSSYDADADDILAEAQRAARLAVQSEDSNALAHLVLGRVLGQKGDFEAGIAECEMAVRLNPNLTLAHHELGFINTFAGHFASAVPCFDQAIRLSPNDPSRWNFYNLKGIALTGLEQFVEAIACFKEAARQRPTAFWPHVNIAICLFELGRMDEARVSLQEALVRKPDLNKSFIEEFERTHQFEPRGLWTFGHRLQELGLPE